MVDVTLAGPASSAVTTPQDVVRLRGSVPIEYSLARHGAERLWDLFHNEPYVNALGAMTGGQAIEMVKAGLKAIYLSGWQVAADANLSEQVYPDQSLYAANSVPAVVRRINNALRRADQIEWAEAMSSEHGAPRVDGAHRGRRRGGLRWRAERLRTDEGDDRGRRRGRALRRSVVLGEEVRSHGRQGAHSDRSAHSHPEGGAAGGGRRRRADADRGAHRLFGLEPVDQRRRPSRQGVPHWRALRGGLLLRAPRHRSGRCPRFGVRALRRPDLVRNIDARISSRRGSSPSEFTSSSRASCSPTTAHPPSTGGRTWTTRRSPRSSESSATWDTRSSS